MGAKKPVAEEGFGKSKKNRGRYTVTALALSCVCACIVVMWWIRSSKRVETDNAYVETRIIPLTAKISGTIKKVHVDDNQFVKKGELLIEIDQRDYKVLVDKAVADVGIARNETMGEYKKAESAKAALQHAGVTLEQAKRDFERSTQLFQVHAISREQNEHLKTAMLQAESQLEAARDSYRQILAEAGLEKGGCVRAKVLQRLAQLEEARLRFSYTRIVAPADGYIAHRNIEPGLNVQANQPLLSLVPLRGAWITANFKERQLGRVRPGLRVEFTVDAYPGRIFMGRVDSIMAGTGSVFSVLPPENATGNFVKVAQRVPVKIVIDGNSDSEQLLRAGMSVQPAVLLDITAWDVLKGLNPFS